MSMIVLCLYCVCMTIEGWGEVKLKWVKLAVDEAEDRVVANDTPFHPPNLALLTCSHTPPAQDTETDRQEGGRGKGI